MSSSPSTERPSRWRPTSREAIAKHPEQPMNVIVLRDGAEDTLVVTPGKKGQNGYLGVMPTDESKSVNPTVMQALSMSLSGTSRARV